jgi:uncharacterized membrane protein YdbT with pleckstrin-like domain
LLPPLQRNNTINDNFKKIGGAKIQSLDFETTSANLKEDHANLTSLSAAQKEHKRKTKEAAEYRAKLLQESNTHEHGGAHSPGAGREKASMKQNKQRKADAKSEEENFEHKATFMQCIFNLSNILMVTSQS